MNATANTTRQPGADLRVFGRRPVKTSPARRPARADATLAAFDVSATLRGESTFFNVYYDDDLGSGVGGALADGVLTRCDADYETLYDIFGSVTPPLPMTVIVAPSDVTGGGAYHHTCIDNVLYCTGDTVADVSFTLALVVAEEVEVFSAAQALGWDCGFTNGEGLSRVLAEELYPGVLDSFHTADIWLDSGRPDYITNNSGSDVDSLSNGCSVLFLYYLRYILGYEWPTIVQIGGATLEQTFERLTGQSGAYTAFRNCVDAFFSPGTPSGLTTDNPFPPFDFYAAADSVL